MKFRLILLILISFSFSKCFAQYGEWLQIEKGKDHVYYLRSHQFLSGDVKKVWIKDVQKKLQSISKTGKKIFLLNGYTISLREVNCSTRQSKLISYVDYNSSGKVIFSNNIEEYEQSWDDVVPDSVGEFLLDKTCELL